MKAQNKIKIFISGANGFIGNHLKKKIDKKYTLLTPNKSKLNLNNSEILKNYLDTNRPHIIVHLASSTKFKKNKIIEERNQLLNTFNITKNLINNINTDCKLIIFFGSIEEYGLVKAPFKEHFKTKPISYYGKYKLKSLQYILKKIKKKNINYLWLRPSLTYGFGDNKERFLASLIESIKKNKTFVINSNKSIRDYLYVEDLIKVLLLIIKNYKKNYKCILNISSEQYVKISKIPIIIEKLINRKIKYKIKSSVSKEIDLYSSNKKLIRYFPKLNFKSFKKGLKQILKHEKII